MLWRWLVMNKRSSLPWVVGRDMRAAPELGSGSWRWGMVNLMTCTAWLSCFWGSGLTAGNEDDIRLLVAAVHCVKALEDALLGGTGLVGHALPGEGHD